MVEALNIHSIVFDIADRMGLGKDIGLAITIFILLILVIFDYAYIFSGIKVYLVLHAGVGLFGVLLLHSAAIKVNLNGTPEVTHITHFLICAVLLSTAIVAGHRALKTKILDPIYEKNAQKDFEQFLKEEGIDPDSTEAKELQAVGVWNFRDIMKFIMNIDFDDREDSDSVK